MRAALTKKKTSDAQHSRDKPAAPQPQTPQLTSKSSKPTDCKSYSRHEASSRPFSVSLQQQRQARGGRHVAASREGEKKTAITNDLRPTGNDPVPTTRPPQAHTLPRIVVGLTLSRFPDHVHAVQNTHKHGRYQSATFHGRATPHAPAARTSQAPSQRRPRNHRDNSDIFHPVSRSRRVGLRNGHTGGGAYLRPLALAERQVVERLGVADEGYALGLCIHGSRPSLLCSRVWRRAGPRHSTGGECNRDTGGKWSRVCAVRSVPQNDNPRVTRSLALTRRWRGSEPAGN